MVTDAHRLCVRARVRVPDEFARHAHTHTHTCRLCVFETPRGGSREACGTFSPSAAGPTSVRRAPQSTRSGPASVGSPWPLGPLGHRQGCGGAAADLARRGGPHDGALAERHPVPGVLCVQVMHPEGASAVARHAQSVGAVHIALDARTWTEVVAAGTGRGRR